MNAQNHHNLLILRVFLCACVCVRERKYVCICVYTTLIQCVGVYK